MQKNYKIDVFGNGEKIILFAHANSFPPASYKKLFAAFGDDFTVIAPIHPAMWLGRKPHRWNTWRIYLDEVREVLRSLNGRPCYLVGHSMGALIMQYLACESHQFDVDIRGSFLLDPAAAPEWALAVMHIAPMFFLRRLSFINKALNRPEAWPSFQHAFNFHRKSSTFSRIADDVLFDYMQAVILPPGKKSDQYTLAFSGAWEAQIYTTIPLFWPSMRKVKNKNWVLFGSESKVYYDDFQLRDQRRSPASVFLERPGGHLFPLEYPIDTAEKLVQLIAKT